MPKTPDATTTPAELEHPARGKRLSLSDVLERLLDRGPTDHSSVTLTRNAKGDTQIEVVVRTGDSGEVQTADEAAAKARELYDDLRVAYPHSSEAEASAGS